ncbi:MAG TPA: Ldh family oxidoreductase [Limnochorda sp.]
MAENRGVGPFTEAELRARCMAILEKVGMPREAAEHVAACLVLAELRGVRSHGVTRMPVYVERIRRGSMDPKATPVVLRETAAVAVMDARNGHGIPVGAQAMDLAIAKARAAGVGVVTVRNSNHFGMAWYFVKRAVEQDMIGVAMSNADSFVAPWGAGKRYLGTNPMAVGIPAGEEVPIGLDMATSVVAHGKIKLAYDSGQPIPLGWALDASGAPTTDPAKALEGALLPFGEAKGSAISLIIDMLCGPLAGALTGPFIAPLFTAVDRPQGLGHFFMAVNVAAFADLATYKREVDEAIRRIHALPPAAGFDRVLVPGELELEREREARKTGIFLAEPAARDLEALEKSLNIA